MTDIANASASPPAAPATKNSFQRIAGVLFAPAETFQDIARKPDILVPLIVLILIGYVTVFFLVPRVDWAAASAVQMESMQKQQPNMSQEDRDRTERMITAASKIFWWFVPLMGVLWWVIIAAVLLLAFRMTGGQGTFKQAVSATLYSWVPLTVAGIILTIVVVARGELFDPTLMATVVKSNPAFLVDFKAQPILFALLSSLDIFMIWTIALLIIGFAKLSNSSMAKAATIVILLWVVTILIKVGFAAMGAARMNA